MELEWYKYWLRLRCHWVLHYIVIILLYYVTINGMSRYYECFITKSTYLRKMLLYKSLYCLMGHSSGHRLSFNEPKYWNQWKWNDLINVTRPMTYTSPQGFEMISSFETLVRVFAPFFDQPLNHSTSFAFLFCLSLFSLPLPLPHSSHSHQH